MIEKRNKFKQTKFYNYDLDKLSNKVYVEGHFECEKYFEKYKDDLKNEFNILDSFKYQNNKYYNDILSNNKIVSICVRQNRYSEREGNLITNYQLLNLINLHMILFNIYTEPFRFCEKKIR